MQIKGHQVYFRKHEQKRARAQVIVPIVDTEKKMRPSSVITRTTTMTTDDDDDANDDDNDDDMHIYVS